jgi:hypothetical protein
VKVPTTMENLLGKQIPLSGAVPLAPAMRRVAPATIELESHFTLLPTWRTNYHKVKTMASMLFESVSGSPVARVDSGT